ncbi:hypothetical protein D3C72_1678740 [compost metagenome]
MLIAEPGAETAETTDHLIGDEENVARLADAGDFRPIGLRRHNHATGALNGFGHKSGNVFLTELVDLRFEFPGDLQAEFGR